VLIAFHKPGSIRGAIFSVKGSSRAPFIRVVVFIGSRRLCHCAHDAKSVVHLKEDFVP